MSAEAKLSKLKVADLKQILAQVSLPTTGKKSDLIAQILASPAALKAAGIEASTTTASDLDAEYDEPQSSTDTPTKSGDAGTSAAVAQNGTSTNPSPSTSAQPAPAEQPATVTGTSTTAAAPSSTNKSVPQAAIPKPASVHPQDDLERRKARAARFGIPLVDDIKKTTGKADSRSKATATTAKPTASTADGEEKLKKRAEKFGTAKTAVSTGPVDQAGAVDPAEEERRRKRAERFGLAKDAPPAKKVKSDA
ncbi:hypothetical protein FRB99_004280 [Tulasnella sp. 403]|nr:hypothetical protein FRB99_004280 [Tulasnella sp. 403]